MIRAATTRRLAPLLILLLAGCATADWSGISGAAGPTQALADGDRVAVAVGQSAGALAAPDSLGLAESDVEAMLRSARYALDNPRVNQATTWSNRATGHAGALTPRWLERSPEGRECRDYIQLLALPTLRLQALGSACRASDGHWLIVR